MTTPQTRADVSRSTERVHCTSSGHPSGHAPWCGALKNTTHHTHDTPGHQGTPATCDTCHHDHFHGQEI